MADELDHYRQLLMDDRRETHALAAEARAALAQPELHGPTDEELLELMPETMRDEFSYAAKTCSDAMGGRVKPGIFRVALNTAALEYAQAVLQRWGRPAIKPVPVAERLPGPGDCDTEGECWWWHPDHKEDEFSDGWMLLKPKWADGHHDADDSPVHTHWLPHHALPVPQQEAE
jgi:hypothetical protein